MLKIKELKTEKSVNLSDNLKVKTFVCSRNITKQQIKLHLRKNTTDVVKKINKLNFTTKKRLKGTRGYSIQKLTKFYVYLA